MSDNGRRGDEGPGTGVVIKAKPKTKKPSMYKVLMLNDDYTPMEFVVHILERFFNKINVAVSQPVVSGLFPPRSFPERVAGAQIIRRSSQCLGRVN